MTPDPILIGWHGIQVRGALVFIFLGLGRLALVEGHVELVIYGIISMATTVLVLPYTLWWGWKHRAD